MSAGAAAALAGLPRQARASLAVCLGGRLTLGARVYQLDDPHAMSSLEPANVVQQVCELLTRTGHANITRPHLLSHWTVSPDLRTWTLSLLPAVTRHNGRRFTAPEPVWPTNPPHAPDPP